MHDLIRGTEETTKPSMASHGSPSQSTPARRVSRRALLACAATSVAVGGLAKGPLTRAQAAATPEAGAARIGIVGAGIAGLNPALTLHDAGVGVTIFEAADRVGGRMHSNTTTWAEGQTSEWCAELIDTAHTTIQALAGRFGLLLVDLLAAEPAGAASTYFFFDRYYPVAAAQRDFDHVYPTLREQLAATGPVTRYDTATPESALFDRMSVAQWIDRYVPGGYDAPLGRLLDVVFATEDGREPAELSALTLIVPQGEQPELFGFSDERFHIEGGNQCLPEAIASHIASTAPACDLRLGWRMTAIRREADAVIVSCATATGLQEERFDHVVLALPFSVLRTLDVTLAGFDALKRQAITELAYGTNAKLQLQFDSRFWRERGPWPGISNGSISTDTGMQNCWEVTRGQPGTAGIINIYTGGLIGAGFRPEAPFSSSEESAVVRYAAKQLLAQMEQVWPGATAHYSGTATLSYPAGDPNVLGSYPTYTIGQVTSFGGYEGVRQGNIHFAGDHCSEEFQGFMEGAARAGARAAREILADLGERSMAPATADPAPSSG
jgi:monoamine oxidase